MIYDPWLPKSQNKKKTFQKKNPPAKKILVDKNGHFVAWIDTKTGNKQQKHDLVNCPPISTKKAPSNWNFWKIKKKSWLYTLSENFPMAEQAHNYNFQNQKKTRGPRGYDPPQHCLLQKMVKFYKNGRFIAWLDPTT